MRANPAFELVPFEFPATPSPTRRQDFFPDEDSVNKRQKVRDEDDQTGDEHADKKEEWFPVVMPSRQQELDHLGPPSLDTEECFGCVRFGEKEPIIPSEELEKFIELSRQSIGRVNWIVLAQHLGNFYEHKIRRVVNAELEVGEEPLPYWPGADILRHIRRHNQDPLILLVIKMEEARELSDELYNCCFEVSNKTGKKRVNKAAIDAYEKISKLQMSYHRVDHTKMTFSSNGARLNPKILDEGLLSTHTKRFHAMLKK